MSNPDDAGGYRVDAGSSEAGRTTTITGSTGTTSTGPAAGRRKLHFSMTPVSRRRDKSEGYMDTDEDDDDAENTSPEYDGDGEDDAWSVPGSPKAATTPTFQQSYANLRRNLSVKSLRELELKHVQSKLWRKQGEIRKRPRDLEQLAIHAASGAARAFILGYSLRSGVNLVTTLVRLIQRRRFQFQLILKAVLAKDAFRFGSMFGSFALLWKTTLHLLRIYNPGTKGRQRTEFWHAPLAGAVSGLAILAESPKNRAGIAQQLLVRGLQGWYNIMHARGHINIPHGDILLFGAACGQIMYSWLVSPESLNPGYSNWISNASKVPRAVLPWAYARHRFSDQMPPLDQARSLLARRDISPMNALRIEKIIDDCNKGDYGVAFPPCEMVHPWLDSCKTVQVTRFRDVFGWIFPVYAGLHFIPPILLKRKQFVKAPLPQIVKSFLGSCRSSAFLATFVVICQAQVCARHQSWDWARANLPKWMHAFWLSRYGYWVMGASTCLALFIEEKKRRGELAMYVLPKALESAWASARRRAYVPFIPGGDVLLNCAALSMVMSTYRHEPKMLSGLVRTIVYQVTGLD